MYPAIILWLYLKRKHHFDHNVPSDHMVITFQKKTAQKPGGSLWKKTLVSFTILFTMYPLWIWATHSEFFHKVLCNHNVSNHMLKEFFESLWQNWATVWFLGDFFEKNLLGTFWLHCRVLYERILNEWLRSRVDTLWTKLWKKPGFSFTKNPLVFVLFSFGM